METVKTLLLVAALVVSSIALPTAVPGTVSAQTDESDGGSGSKSSSNMTTSVATQNADPTTAGSRTATARPATTSLAPAVTTSVAVETLSPLHRQCLEHLLAWSPWSTKTENIVSDGCGVRRRGRKFRKTITEDLERQCKDETPIEYTQYKEDCKVLTRHENVEVIQYYFVDDVFGHTPDIEGRQKRFFDFNPIFGSDYSECPTDKTKLPVDFLIMLDKSGSMTLRQFRLLLRSMKFLVNKGIPKVSQHSTHIGMVTFANNPTIEFDFNRCDDKPCVVEQIYNTEFNGGLTRMAVALESANDVFTHKHGMRDCSRRVVLIVTDGSSSDYNHISPKAAADKLKAKDVEIFAIGITELINERQLRDIVSYPELTHLYYMPDVKQTRRVFKKIQTATALDA